MRSQKFFALVITIVVTGSITFASNSFAGNSTHKARDDKHNIYLSDGSVTGGEITDGRNIYSIRWGKHSTFERIVFDIHEGVYGEDYGPTDVPCHFEIRYEPSRLKFEVEFNGARDASATIPELTRSRLIRYIDSKNLQDDSAIGYIIKLKRAVKFEVFELHNPARVVIDVTMLYK